MWCASAYVSVTGILNSSGRAEDAKLTVDEIDVPARRMLVRLLVNRNCGYRSLTAGVPKD